MKKIVKYYLAQIMFTKSGKSIIYREEFPTLREAKNKLQEIKKLTYIVVKETKEFYEI